MAITGSGTQEDPWVVHSYEELQTTFDGVKQGNGHYIQLGNDINCNDYGASFEWETLTPSPTVTFFDLDLNNHTIKNVKVAPNNYMFTAVSGTNMIHDGAILNIFLDSAYGVASGSGNLTFKNVSMSVNGTGARSYAFNLAFFYMCAVYYECEVLPSMPFMNYTERGLTQFKNSDIYLAINDLNGKRIAGKDTNYGGTTIGFDNCRIRGEVKGTPAASYVIGTCTSVNSVCDLDMTQLEVSSATAVFIAGTGVINEDKFADGISAGTGMTAVTDTEIINGAALRANNFVVVNVPA